MKRHAALEPFSRDHNVGLILARELTRADVGVGEKLVAVWQDEMEDHFQQEEDLLIPLAGEALSARLVAEHRAFADFVAKIAKGDADAELLRQAGELLTDHIRWEEREFFVDIEQNATEAELANLVVQTDRIEKSRAESKWAPRRGELMKRRQARSDSRALAQLGETGPLWGYETEDLNCTLLCWPENHRIEEHVNSEVDVVMTVLSGKATVIINGSRAELSEGMIQVIAKGSRREIIASEGPLVYINVHKRRRKLMPTSLESRPRG